MLLSFSRFRSEMILKTTQLGNEKGMFTVKSAYHLYMTINNPENSGSSGSDQ
jgi:hypothetical protein